MDFVRLFHLIVFGKLKTDIIMTNTKLIFLSTLDEYMELECFNNKVNEITIRISDTDSDHQWSNQLVSLDIPTAIKLSKVLRTEINKAKEVNNG